MFYSLFYFIMASPPEIYISKIFHKKNTPENYKVKWVTSIPDQYKQKINHTLQTIAARNPNDVKDVKILLNFTYKTPTPDKNTRQATKKVGTHNIDRPSQPSQKNHTAFSAISQ